MAVLTYFQCGSLPNFTRLPFSHWLTRFCAHFLVSPTQLTFLQAEAHFCLVLAATFLLARWNQAAVYFGDPLSCPILKKGFS